MQRINTEHFSGVKGRQITSAHCQLSLKKTVALKKWIRAVHTFRLVIVICHIDFIYVTFLQFLRRMLSCSLSSQ